MRDTRQKVLGEKDMVARREAAAGQTEYRAREEGADTDRALAKSLVPEYAVPALNTLSTRGILEKFDSLPEVVDRVCFAEWPEHWVPVRHRR